MFGIQNLFTSAVSSFQKAYEESPVTVAVTTVCAAAAIGASALYLYNRSQSNPDLETIRSIASKVKKTELTIGDASEYSFVKTHNKTIGSHKTVAASIALVAMSMKAHHQGTSFHKEPRLIVELGTHCLKQKSGVCDHMSAAFVAGVVDHIQNGGKWNSNIEIVGNGGHSFAVVGRESTKPITHLGDWGNKAVTVDPWLGYLEMKEEVEDQPRGKNGVFTGREAITHARFFGGLHGKRLKVLSTLTPQVLYDIAQSIPKVQLFQPHLEGV